MLLVVSLESPLHIVTPDRVAWDHSGGGGQVGASPVEREGRNARKWKPRSRKWPADGWVHIAHEGVGRSPEAKSFEVDDVCQRVDDIRQGRSL